MTAYNVRDLDPTRYVIIDPETGTVIGTHAVIVEIPESDEDYYSMLESYRATAYYADRFGAPLTVLDSDLTKARQG